MVFIGCAEEEVEEDVELPVLLEDMVELAFPDRTSWEGEVVVDEPEDVPVPLLAIIIEVPTPNNVVDPRVVVLVDPLVVYVETIAEVVIADVESTVIVVE